MEIKNIYVPRLFDKPSSFEKIKLKYLKFTFSWNTEEIEDRAKISRYSFFSKIVN